MQRYNKDTEKKILEVAKKIFREKGFDGTKTQEIADEAGINKALLHYYFKTKSSLFQRVFLSSLEEIFTVLGQHINNDQPLLEKTPALVSSYMDYIEKNVNLFVFVISEVWQNQEFTQKFVQVALERVDFKDFYSSFRKEVESGSLRDINPVHYLLNLISLSIFPFIVSPILKNILATMEINVSTIIRERKEVVTQSLIAMVKK